MKSNSAKWVLRVVIVVIIIAIISGFSKSTKDSNVIKIGYFGPQTGPVAATTGLDIITGFKLAHEKNNMIGDKKIEVIYEDDACDSQKAVAAANKLISIDKVNIIVSGVCSGSSASAAPVAEKSKVILFTPVSTTPKLTTAGDYVFRTSASAVVTAQAMADYIASHGYKKVAVMYEAAEYPTGIKDAFIIDIAKTGVSVVATESSAPKETDFRSQLTKISKANPDIMLVVMNSTVTAMAALKQRSELQIKAPVIGNEYFIQKEVITSPIAEGIMASTYKYDAKSPAILDLVARFKDKIGTAPSQDMYVALAYDGYNVLFSAMQKCGGDDPECIKAELYKVKDYQGISGVITIDQNGDTAREFVIKKIHNGVIEDAK